MTTTLRVASWPHWYAPNRYIERYQAALASHGIEHVPDLPLNARQLARHGVQVAHLHWAEWAWQSKGRLEFRRRRGVGALTQFLDDADRLGITIVWTVHNLAAHGGDTPSDTAGFSMLHQRAKLRIFHSHWARAQALARFGASGQTAVMPHGNYDGVLPLPTAPDDVRRALGIPPGCALLLCAGNVKRYKGIELAVNAVEAWSDGRVCLVVAGRCPDNGLRRELDAMASRRRDLRTIWGPLTDQRLSDLLHAADVVLLPYSDVTGSGALLTALSAGRGVVCTDLPYFREVLAPEPFAGVLAHEQTPVAVAQAIETFIAGEPGLRHAAARRLADRYAWPTVVTPVVDWLLANGGR